MKPDLEFHEYFFRVVVLPFFIGGGLGLSIFSLYKIGIPIWFVQTFAVFVIISIYLLGGGLLMKSFSS